MIRPKTLFPFPKEQLASLAAEKRRTFIVVELNEGMMADDVQLAVGNDSSVLRYNWLGGVIPTVDEIVDRVKSNLRVEV